MIELINENQLDNWVRGNAENAQAKIVELIYRLVAASCPGPQERRFPLGDSVGQHGPDGYLDTKLGYPPFVPEGKSYWEIGTGLDAHGKATSDYRELTAATPKEVRAESSFVFVTPLSGRRTLEYTWKEEGQASWRKNRADLHDWNDVRVIDGTRLIDWVHHFPGVELWLAQEIIHIPAQQIETLDHHWDVLSAFGAPPPLTTQLFLANREEALAKIKEVFNGTLAQLKLTTHFPDHATDFVSAYLSSLDEDSRVDAAGRCLIVSGSEAWTALCDSRVKHILIAEIGLDLNGETGTRLIQIARRAGHAVIFGGPQGGIPDPASAPLRMPTVYHVQDALVKGRYPEERARTLAQKSGGNLKTLLRCLLNLSVMPEWAEGTDAAELAIAALLGAWAEDSDADPTAVENLSGKSYGEWIGKIREVALRPGTPLVQHEAKWKFVSRYEGWYALGRTIFDQQLDRLLKVAATVLTEIDPQFELAADKRYAAGIYNKVLTHSNLLRQGLAESLALLGSHPKALTSCSLGKAEVTAALAVRQILVGGDWKRWAGLNDLLPLLAEASPEEFLDAVESALRGDPCPFDQLFAEEGNGALGRTYISGLLWALETLAWDANYLVRVIVCLGRLAARDPGGKWMNRPANSMREILLPWYLQTCAPSSKRLAAVKALIAEYPNVGWQLLVSLLPQQHAISSGTRKPAWRETIPEDWRQEVRVVEYQDEVEAYSELAISEGRKDVSKLVALIDGLETFPPRGRKKLLDCYASTETMSLAQDDRLRLWSGLDNLVKKHRRFPSAVWAMKPEQVNEIAVIANRLAPNAPFFRDQPLFGENDFATFEEQGDYDEQMRRLEERRRKAVEEISSTGGTSAVIAFAQSVQSAWRVGIAFGAVASQDSDSVILPSLLASEQKSLTQFAGGFVWGRFRDGSWGWVDKLNLSQWSSDQISLFLAYLPFCEQTWERAARLLGSAENAYWTKTSANPYEAQARLEVAVDHLIRYERPHAAIRCLSKMLRDNKVVDTTRSAQALLAAVNSQETPNAMDIYETVELIKALQADETTNANALFQIEWAYLPLLNEHHEASPRLLWRRLADLPAFYCEIIRLAFKPRNEDRPRAEPSEDKKRIAGNAYELLSEWMVPPGLRPDGSFNGVAFQEWMDAVRKECTETGHLEIAMDMAGHVLIYVPSDPDGLWIHHSVATALNQEDAEGLRNGYRAALFNSRGVHWLDPTGKPERDLADKYRTQAEAVDSAGYYRLAATLRELAGSYDREAEQNSSRDPFDN
jgi:hypothetical protein